MVIERLNIFLVLKIILEIGVKFCASRSIIQSVSHIGVQDSEPKHELWDYNKNGLRKPDHEIKILAFGDSLTEGYHDNGNRFYPYTTKLEELLNEAAPPKKRYDVINEGISGECVYVEMATRFPELLKKYNPKLAIILGGTNDLNKLDCEKDLNLFYELKSLHEMAHKAGALSVAVTIPEANVSNVMLSFYNTDKYKEIRDSTNKKLRDYATHEPKTVLCDLSQEFPYFSLDDEERSLLWSDPVHPSKEGYKKMADIIYASIKDLKLV